MVRKSQPVSSSRLLSARSKGEIHHSYHRTDQEYFNDHHHHGRSPPSISVLSKCCATHAATNLFGRCADRKLTRQLILHAPSRIEIDVNIVLLRPSVSFGTVHALRMNITNISAAKMIAPEIVNIAISSVIIVVPVLSGPPVVIHSYGGTVYNYRSLIKFSSTLSVAS